MDFIDFTKMMVCKVQLYMGSDYEVTERSVTKNNSVTLTGIMAKHKDAKAYPTIYVDDIYDSSLEEKDVDYLAMKMAQSLANSKIDEEECLQDFTGFETAGKSIFLKVINAEKNKELLQDVPYRRFHNLAIVYYYSVNEKTSSGIATVLVNNEFIKKWEVDENTLYETAMDNIKAKCPPSISSMYETLEKLGANTVPDKKAPMYVICNEKQLFGARAIIDLEFLHQVSENIGCGFYILPSSIHELIIIPETIDTCAKDLVAMVTEINLTEVSAEEMLADSVYFYNQNEHKVLWLA